MSASVFRSARLISAITLLSRVFGLARDMACSYAYGVGGAMSAFTVAFQIPNLFRRLFGEGALSAATIPVLSETLSRRGRAEMDAVAGKLVTLLVLLLGGLCVTGEIIIGFWYWSLDAHQAGGAEGNGSLVLGLTALMLPYMIFICVTAILGGIENILGGFAIPAAIPIILNVFNIAAALSSRWIMPDDLRKGVWIQSVSVMIAGIVQLAVQWFATRRRGLSLKPRVDWRDPSIARIAITMAPMLAGLAAVQLNTFADSVIAYIFVKEQIGTGDAAESVGSAVLYFAQRLYQFPLGVFSAALATAIFPTLSRYSAEGNTAGLGQTLSKAIRVATFEGVPCMVGLILISRPIVVVMFKRGEFAAWGEAVDRVSFAVAMYALGIWATSLNQIVVRAFYAMQDVRTPLRVSVQNVVLNLGLNLILVNTPLKEAGLALSTSLCATLQIGILLWKFQNRAHTLDHRDILSGVGRTLSAAAVMALAVLGVQHWLVSEHAAVVQLAVLVAVGGAAYLGAAWALGCKEIRHVLRR